MDRDIARRAVLGLVRFSVARIPGALRRRTVRRVRATSRMAGSDRLVAISQEVRDASRDGTTANELAT